MERDEVKDYIQMTSELTAERTLAKFREMGDKLYAPAVVGDKNTIRRIDDLEEYPVSMKAIITSSSLFAGVMAFVVSILTFFGFDKLIGGK